MHCWKAFIPFILWRVKKRACLLLIIQLLMSWIGCDNCAGTEPKCAHRAMLESNGLRSTAVLQIKANMHSGCLLQLDIHTLIVRPNRIYSTIHENNAISCSWHNSKMIKMLNIQHHTPLKDTARHYNSKKERKSTVYTFIKTWYNV